MIALGFAVDGVRVERYAVAPLIALQLRVTESTGAELHSIALRVQVRIEPRGRRYTADESGKLIDMFGPPERYGTTLQPLLWTHVAAMVHGFSGATTVDVQLPVSYDFEVAANKYLGALEAGEIPLLLLFSGTVFVRAENGFAVELIPWELEARFRLPVSAWREAIDAFFPGTAWIRLGRDAFDELARFKSARGLPTWDAALAALRDAAAVKP
ncbi:MAG: DUF6084 family protein [Vulcanimicrobiaceae bacterium]